MLEGVLLALTPVNLLFALIGVVLGVVVGAIPGLTATLGIALLVPVTFVVSPETGMIMLAGVYAGGVYGGTITAILINVPGTPASIPTMWEGHPLTLQGHSRTALGTAALASAVGGLASGVVLFSLSPALASVALKLSPADYAVVILFGLVAVTLLMDRRVLASCIGALVGMTLGLIGSDPGTGGARFTFGMYQLFGGLGIVPVLVGIFCLTEAVRLAAKNLQGWRIPDQQALTGSRLLPNLRTLRANGWNFTRSSVLGTGIGIMPAIGPETAPFISYSLAKRASRERDRYGKGSYEGLIAAETSNNAVVGGSLIPTLTLGLPGSGAAAVFIGALTIHGLRPGPTLFTDQQDLMYALFTGFIVANLFMLLVGLLFVKQFALVLKLPVAVLATAVAALSVLGAYALGSNIFDVTVMLGSAALALVLIAARIPLAPVVLGLILGPLLEVNLSRAFAMSKGSFDIFYTSPVFWLVVVMSVALLIWNRRSSAVMQGADDVVSESSSDTAK